MQSVLTASVESDSADTVSSWKTLKCGVAHYLEGLLLLGLRRLHDQGRSGDE